MNLYLSSYRLGNRPDLLQAMVGSNKRAAVIANSMDYVDESNRKRGVDREIIDLHNLGFEPEELDLRDYFSKPEELNAKLDEFGLVWSRGGNAFLLRQAMDKSGFDAALVNRLADNEFVYAGYSAGIVVLCPTLEGLELVDSIEAKPSGYESETLWRGLGLLDYCIAPHFESDHPESEDIGKVVEYFKDHELAYKTLHDGEVIIVRNSTESVVR